MAKCDTTMCDRQAVRLVEVRQTDQFGAYVVQTHLCKVHEEQAMGQSGGFRATRSTPLRYA